MAENEPEMAEEALATLMPTVDDYVDALEPFKDVPGIDFEALVELIVPRFYFLVLLYSGVGRHIKRRLNYKFI